MALYWQTFSKAEWGAFSRGDWGEFGRVSPGVVIGPGGLVPTVAYPAMVDVKTGWNSAWYYVPEFEFLGGTQASSGQGLSEVTLQRRYGSIKLPWESDFSTKTAWPNTRGLWVRVRMIGVEGAQTAWVGRIEGVSHDVHGDDVAASGAQMWQCYGPEQILRKTAVGTSFWFNGVADPLELGWVPSMNDRDGRAGILGNKAQGRSLSDPSYVYGGTDTWTRYDYAEYILARFVDQGGTNGPAWTLGGQADLLRDMTDVIHFGDSATAEDILRQLISPKLGVDYTIVSTNNGFEISVYALLAKEYSFGGFTLPKNPNTVQVRVGQTIDSIQTTLAASAENAYGKIRVRGRRIVVCCSLVGPDVVQPGLIDRAGTLEAKWKSSLESEYQQGDINYNTAELNDRARRNERFRPVYGQFGAPSNWDLGASKAAPKLDGMGVLQSADVATYQTKIRRTLSWLPLREGFDYSQDPPTDNNKADHEPELWKPAIWLANVNPDDDGDDYFVKAEDAGVSVSVPNNDWGVWLAASPNHLIAASDFTPGDGEDSEVDPQYDWRGAVATIAFEADQRLEVVFTLPDGDPTQVLDVEVADAEYWYLAPNTAIQDDSIPQHGTNRSERRLKLSPGNATILRDDSQKLCRIMAGAIARYATPRARAEIVVDGLLPWSGLIGHVLTVVDDGGQLQEIEAPITAVSWQRAGDSSRTVIRTGFAQ